jgi:heptosyltransferase-2
MAPIRTLRLVTGWRPRRIPLNQARRILVIRPDEIGDLVLTTPLLRALRMAASQAHIALIVNNTCRELVETCPYVNAVYSLEFVFGTRLLRLSWATTILRSSRLLWRGFDLVLLPRRGPGTYRAEVVGHMLAGRGVILSNCDSLEGLAVDVSEPPIACERFVNLHAEHEVEHNLRFLCWCGVESTQKSYVELWLSAMDRAFAARHLPDTGHYVAIASGARMSERCWPVDHFAHVASILEKDNGLIAVQLGGPNDPSFPGGINLIGRTTLRQAAAIIARCVLFVGNDSGLLHIAAALAVPVVEVSGFRQGGRPCHPNSPTRFGPWGVTHRVVQPSPGQSNLAIEEVTIKAVCTACSDLLTNTCMRARAADRAV